MRPLFMIKQMPNDRYYFTLTAENGQTLMHSEGYSSKSACENGIETFKANCNAGIDDQTGVSDDK